MKTSFQFSDLPSDVPAELIELLVTEIRDDIYNNRSEFVSLEDTNEFLKLEQ